MICFFPDTYFFDFHDSRQIYVITRNIYTAIVTTVSNGQRSQSDMKNKMAADVDGSRHFSSLSRRAQ